MVEGVLFKNEIVLLGEKVKQILQIQWFWRDPEKHGNQTALVEKVRRTDIQNHTDTVRAQ
jgi:hypothetical protein